MNHTSTIQTSRSVLVASIVICSSLALLSLGRFVTNRVQSGDRADSNELIATANQEQARGYSEFRPHPVEMNGAPATVVVRSDAELQSETVRFSNDPQSQIPVPPALRSEGAPQTAQSCDVATEPPQISGPVTMHVDHSALLAELRRVHERIDDLSTASVSNVAMIPAEAVIESPGPEAFDSIDSSNLSDSLINWDETSTHVQLTELATANESVQSPSDDPKLIATELLDSDEPHSGKPVSYESHLTGPISRERLAPVASPNPMVVFESNIAKSAPAEVITNRESHLFPAAATADADRGLPNALLPIPADGDSEPVRFVPEPDMDWNYDSLPRSFANEQSALLPRAPYKESRQAIIPAGGAVSADPYQGAPQRSVGTMNQASERTTVFAQTPAAQQGSSERHQSVGIQKVTKASWSAVNQEPGNSRSARTLHRLASMVRFAARPKTVD